MGTDGIINNQLQGQNGSIGLNVFPSAWENPNPGRIPSKSCRGLTFNKKYAIIKVPKRKSAGAGHQLAPPAILMFGK